MPKASKFDPTRSELVIKFPTVAAASAFKSWLSNSGEQDYWTHMEVQDNGPENQVLFDYHGPDTNVIETKPYSED